MYFWIRSIAELEEFLNVGTRCVRCASTCRQLLQADEFTDAVIDVDNQIADFQIAKVRKKRAREISTLLRAASLFLEDVGLRINLKAGLFEEESLRKTSARDKDSR